MVKIDIISGFLGAGKTTLIKKLLGEVLKGQKVVLIENEFGEIGIDGGFLKEAGIEIREMNSGCICCSLVGDFGTALKEVIEKYQPERILIEPSGVGKLSDVIGAVQKLQMDDVVLNSYTTVVDAKKCKMFMKNFGEFFDDQVQAAGAIVMSRTDLANEGKIKEAWNLLREKNEKAVIITTPLDELDGDKLLEAMENPVPLEADVCPVCGGHHDHDEEHEHDEHCGCGHDHDHHHDHEEHEHDEHCGCGHDHDHHHDHEEHEHDEHCGCGHDHDHHHDHEEHEHDEHCGCGHDHDHHHDHDEHCGCGHDHHEHHHHHADEVFTSWGHETINKYSAEQMKEILNKLSETNEYGTILRAKGMVPTEDGSWIHFDMVPGEIEVRNGGAEYTGRLCVIGAELKEDKIEELFGV
ncbi:MAG: GTP-binding protein [Lachnospiraceae bacterium]|nr:GTP-binding protein [Lachnospiraceae bacterium]MDD3616939.1 GTP-binding protein [Lachnospiraceae bacterium]